MQPQIYIILLVCNPGDMNIDNQGRTCTHDHTMNIRHSVE